MIELSHVSKCYNTGTANRFTAVDDVSLTIGRGKVTVLKGPSGSGKTTLMTLIGCMARPTSGRIVLSGIPSAACAIGRDDDEVEIAGLPDRFLTGIRRSSFGFIFQQFNLVRGITVLENVLLPTYPTGDSYVPCRERALKLLELLNISRYASSPADRLSGGEMQRVAIARALINDPAVIIADEPTAHLDSRLSRDFMEIVASLRSEGKTLLIASHDPIVFDSPLVDVVVGMRDGRITDLSGTP